MSRDDVFTTWVAFEAGDPAPAALTWLKRAVAGGSAFAYPFVPVARAALTPAPWSPAA